LIYIALREEQGSGDVGYEDVMGARCGESRCAEGKQRQYSGDPVVTDVDRHATQTLGVAQEEDVMEARKETVCRNLAPAPTVDPLDWDHDVICALQQRASSHMYLLSPTTLLDMLENTV
jgi:hypothetical protein